MSKFWNEKANSITPYTPGEQPEIGKKVIKLNTNECPYEPSKEVLKVLQQQDISQLRLYPNADGYAVREAFANFNNVDVSNVFVGNGSDEVLAIAFQTFFDSKKPILLPEISYSFYPVYCELYNVASTPIKMNDDLSLDLEKFCDSSVDCGGVVIANPNAPTTLTLTSCEIEKILKAHPNCVVLIDEAYVDFGATSVIPLTKIYPNLLVVQTMSKSRALAGIRVGFAVGNKELIQGLDTIKNSFNSYTLDQLAIKCAVASINDKDYFEQTVEKIINTREKVAIKLKQLGFTVLDSKANFLFVSHEKYRSFDIFTFMKQNDIFVRYFKGDIVSKYLRITIGTDEEMDIFISKLLEFISKQ